MKPTPRHNLPAIFGHLLWLTCPAQFREHVLGDLEEAYGSLQKEYGTARARAWYWRECLHSLPYFFVHRVVNVKWRALFWSTLTGAVAAIGTSLGLFWVLKSILGDAPPSVPTQWLFPVVCTLICSVVGGFAATLVHGTQNRVALCLVALVILLPKIGYVITVGQGIATLIASVCLVFLGIDTGARMLRGFKLSH